MKLKEWVEKDKERRNQIMMDSANFVNCLSAFPLDSSQFKVKLDIEKLYS